MAIGFYAELWWVCSENVYCFAIKLSACATLIYVADCARGQDEANPVFWLAHQTGKMGPILPTRDCPLRFRALAVYLQSSQFSDDSKGVAKVTEHTQNKGNIKRVPELTVLQKPAFFACTQK